MNCWLSRLTSALITSGFVGAPVWTFDKPFPEAVAIYAFGWMVAFDGRAIQHWMDRHEKESNRDG